MPIVAVAYHPAIAAERLQEHVHASPNLEVGEAIRCPRCRLTFTVVLPLSSSLGNYRYRNRLKQLIANDCHRGKHQPEYFIDVRDQNSGNFTSNAKRLFDRSRAMEQRQIAYYYNGVLKAEETDLDLDGEIEIPVEGQVVIRPGGKQWRVVKVTSRHDVGNALPIYMVYLTAAQPN